MELTKEKRAEEAKLVAENMETVRKCARKYVGYGVDQADLEQEGMMGLLAAIRSYDPSKGASLATWANLYIRAQIRAALGLNNGEGNKQRKRDRRANSKQSNYRPLGTSLDQPIGPDGDATLHDVVADLGPTPEDFAAVADVAKAIPILSSAQLAFISGRFDNDLTYEEAGALLDTTKQNAHRIEKQAIARMRKVLRA